MFRLSQNKYRRGILLILLQLQRRNSMAPAVLVDLSFEAGGHARPLLADDLVSHDHDTL